MNKQELIDLDACHEGLETFIEAHGDNENVTLLEALESNGVQDVLWYLGKIKLSTAQQNDLHMFACECAESVLHIFETEYPEDDRPRKAIEAKRLYIEGKITLSELDAARVVARAAWAEAWAVAEAAAWAATAAWAAAKAEAWAVAEAVAEAAAEAAAWAVVRADHKANLKLIIKAWES